MIFYGFQKMTLLDFPGKVACTLFTGGCNLRCPFCHNALLVTELSEEGTYTEEEILSYLEKRRGLLDGVAITGGEPLIQKEIVPFIRKVRALGYAVKLDTNGTRPEVLAAILSEGLVDYVAVDIKNAKEKYARTVGVPAFDLSPVEKTVELLMASGVEYEFRTTVTAELHTPSDIRKIGEWIRGAKHYFIQNFVDSGNLISDGFSALPRETLEEMKKIAAEFVPSAALRGV